MASQLAIILSKITHRMPWDEWDLTEAEYDLVENASGPEISETAYKYGLPIGQLIQNSCELIEKHNEQSQQRIFRELKSLKLDLLSAFPRKQKEKASALDSEEIERRLAEETIEEVAGLDTVNTLNVMTPEEIIDIAAALKERGIIQDTIKSKSTFQDKLSKTSIAGSLGSPSLLRNRISEVPDASNITLHDIPAVNVPLLPTNDFDEADLEEVARMGLFDGKAGRLLYDSFKARDSFNSSIAERREIPIPDILAPEEDNLPQALPVEEVPRQTTFGEPSLDVPNENLLQDLTINEPIKQLPQAQTVANVTIDLPSPSGKGRSRLEKFQKQVEEVELQAPQKPKQRKARLKRPSPVAPDPNLTVDLELNNPLVFHHRQPKKPVLHRVLVHEILNKIDVGLFEDVKDFGDDKAGEDYSVNCLNLGLNDLATSASQKVSLVESPLVVAPVSEQTVQSTVRHESSLDVPLARTFPDDAIALSQSATLKENTRPSAASQKVSLVELPPVFAPVDECQVTKRRRIDNCEVINEGESSKATEDGQLINDSIPKPITTFEDLPSTLRQQNSLDVPGASAFPDNEIALNQSVTLGENTRSSAIETPINVFEPFMTSTVATTGHVKKAINTISSEDIEFAILRKVSEQSLNQNVTEKSTVEKLLETLGGPKTKRTKNAKENEASTLEQTRSTAKATLFRTVEGKREKMIEMVVNGRVESYSEYWMETMALYLQTRFLMKERETWKLKFADVVSKVGLLKEKRPHIIESRYMMLAKHGFCKLTLDEDEDHIVEVEIPVKKT